MRVLTHTSKGKLLTIADEVTKLISADKATDKIPTAYPCDGERLVVVVASAKSSYPDDFARFMRSLKRSVTANDYIFGGNTEEVSKKLLCLGKSVKNTVVSAIQPRLCIALVSRGDDLENTVHVVKLFFARLTSGKVQLKPKCLIALIFFF